MLEEKGKAMEWGGAWGAEKGGPAGGVVAAVTSILNNAASATKKRERVYSSLISLMVSVDVKHHV